MARLLHTPAAVPSCQIDILPLLKAKSSFLSNAIYLSYQLRKACKRLWGHTQPRSRRSKHEGCSTGSTMSTSSSDASSSSSAKEGMMESNSSVKDLCAERNSVISKMSSIGSWCSMQCVGISRRCTLSAVLLLLVCEEPLMERFMVEERRLSSSMTDDALIS